MADKPESAVPEPAVQDPRALDDAQWRQRLTPRQYRVLRESGTEPAFTGAYWNHKAPGRYLCAGCGAVLFEAAAKYDSGSGWPSFTAPATEPAVARPADTSLDMVRVEAQCGQCGGHLGHVFPDGPGPTGERFCINSAALTHESNSRDPRKDS